MPATTYTYFWDADSDHAMGTTDDCEVAATLSRAGYHIDAEMSSD